MHALLILIGWACVHINVASAFNASSSDGINASSPVVDAGERHEAGDIDNGALSDDSSSDEIDSTSYYYNNHGEGSRTLSAKYDDEATYLDLFGERAKELLTQHIIPSTDEQCRWDWRMGRCEPYCACGFLFLWGDYHLGRSCRLRPNPPPSLAGDARREGGGEEGADEPSWQEAWQEVWQSQMAEGDVKDASAFVPPMFPKSPPNVAAEGSNANTCNLPPESRYIQIMHQVGKAFDHSTAVMDGLQKIKGATSSAVSTAVVGGRHQWTNLRQGACETVKRKVEERAKIRDQPVILTKQGATWIRRVCGNGGDDIAREGIDSDGDAGHAMEEEEDVAGTNERQESGDGTVHALARVLNKSKSLVRYGGATISLRPLPALARTRWNGPHMSWPARQSRKARNASTTTSIGGEDALGRSAAVARER
ncbi:hypothetical protein ACHAXT_001196 [Thalassiosira profunda]